jgi:hypothetical protein
MPIRPVNASAPAPASDGEKPGTEAEAEAEAGFMEGQALAFSQTA